MGFRARGLSVIGYANGFTLWHYVTPDELAAITRVGYFNAASDLLRTGDFIFANFAMSDRPRHGLLVVTDSDDGRANVAPLVASSAAVGAAVGADGESPHAALLATKR